MTAPHEPALQLLVAGARDRAGAVLLGPAGVGKTWLARSAVDRLGPGFRRVGWVTATASEAAVPFAAVSHLVDVPESGTTAEVLQAARDALGDDLLLVVDDAHLLDRLSAALVHQLVVSGTARVIVTVASGVPVPDEVSALWREADLARVELQPPGHDDARLAALVDEFVADLPAAARRVLAYLAVQDPIARTDLTALAGRDAVDGALDAGAVAVEGPLVRPGHPLFVDAVSHALGGPELRRLRTELVDRLTAEHRPGVVGRLRLAVLALDSDRALAATDAVAAADDALRLGDLRLSERLGRLAAQGAPGLSARLPLAYALAWQGRGRDADAVLGEIDPDDLSESELMAWAVPRAANQFWMLSEPERATAFLLTMRNRVSSPTARATLDALSATFAMNAGNLPRALEVATDVLASAAADDTAVGWAGATAALTAARMGRFAEVDGLAERALAAGHPGLLRFTSGYGQTTALLMAGELDRAQALARQLTDYAQMQQPARAVGDILVADVLIARGDLTAAVRLLRPAATALTPTGYSWGPLAWMLLARALGEQGATVEAGKALSRAESRHGLKSMLFAPELGLARAWTLSARRDPHAAVAAARDAARTAERAGQSTPALRAWHDAARLGDVRAADGIARVDLDCPFGRLAARHARALAAGDAEGLRAAADAFAGVGMHGAAADAAAHADRTRKLAQGYPPANE